MIVRLKDYPGGNFDRIIALFQFYDSPIKRLHIHILKGSIRSCFNSMIVRLKVLASSRAIPRKGRFNSMIVRLKGN